MLQAKEQVGKMDRRITFQESIIITNASNEDEQTGWQDLALNPSVWANVVDRIGAASGGEEYRAEKLTPYLVQEFNIRYRSDITTAMRIMYDGVRFNIITIQNIGRKRYMKITAESGLEYQETQT